MHNSLLNRESIRNNKKTIKAFRLLLLLLIQRLTTDLVILYGVCPIYQLGKNAEINWVSYTLSIAVLVAYPFICPKDKSKLSTWAFVILLIALAVPSTSVYWIMGKKPGYLMLVLVFFIVLSVVLHTNIQIIKSSFSLKGANTLLQFLFAIYVLSCILLIVRRGGIDPRALDFAQIYSLRAEDNIRGVLGYLKNWTIKVFFPFFFMYCYKTNKKAFAILCIILQLMLYLSFGEKTTLFSIALVFAVYFVFTRKNESLLVLGFSVAIFIPFLIYLFSGNYSLFAGLTYRFSYIPTGIGYNYFDFFSSGNPHLWFCETFIGRLFNLTSPYGTTFSYYISGGKGMANTGIIADAYANGGFIVCILFALLLGLLFLMYDQLSHHRQYSSVIASVLGYSCICLMDNGFLMSLVTNGMLLILLLIVSLPNKIPQYERGMSND